MSQAELFAPADLVQPAKPRPPRPAPVPHRLRRHLTEMLGELRWFTSWPWNDREYASNDRMFRGMARDLGPEEEAGWVAKWDAELARLRAGSTKAA